jgi:hypothetical protein
MVIEASWDDIFAAIGYGLMDEASESSIGATLISLIWTQWDQDPSGLEYFPDDLEAIRTLEITEQSLTDVLIQLFALGLIQRGVKKRPISNNNKYWALTSRGEDELLKLRAIRRTTPSPELQETH